MNQIAPRSFPCLLALALAWLLPICLPVQGQERLHIQVGPTSQTNAPDSWISLVRIRAVTADNQLLSHVQTNIPITVELFTTPSLVITEVALDGSAVEFTNPGSEPLDISGWMLHAGNGTAEARGSVQQILPTPTLLPPGGVLLWTHSTNPPTNVAVLSSPRPFPSPRPADLAVYDARGTLIDQLLLTTPRDFRELLWNGPPFSASGPATNSVNRFGSANRSSAADWVVAPRTLGFTNTGLSLPWKGSPIAVPTTPSVITLTNGVWEGTVHFAGASARLWHLAAASPAGFITLSESEPFPAFPRPVLDWIEGDGTASEAAPGRTGRLRLRTQETVPAATVFHLRLDAEGEFQVPATVTIPAGESATEFDVFNLDDASADGDARVLLTAAATGYETASLALLNQDNETHGTLYLVLPSAKPEGAGLLVQRGLVVIPEAATHDIAVHLQSGGRLQIPTTVIIPKDSASVAFRVVVEEDDLVNVPPNDATVQARTGAWPVALANLAITDNDVKTFRLAISDRIHEGTTNEAVITFDRPADKPRTIRISTSGIPAITPETVVLPAGAIEVRFPLITPEDPIVSPDTGLRICLSSELFTPDCRSLTYIDNDLPVERVAMTVPAFAYGPDPVPVTVEIRDSRNRVKSVNGTCRVRVRRPAGEVRIPGDMVELPILDGVFHGSIPLEGQGTRILLEASFHGITNTSPEFTLLRGRTAPMSIADVAAWPGRPTLLALQVGTNAASIPGSLIELDPSNGATLRQLPLPAAAHRLAVSSSGKAAWIVSVSNTLQRVDLTTWTHTSEIPLAPTNGVRNGLLVAIAEGTDDDVLVLTAPARNPANEPFQLVAIRDGQRLPTPYVLGTDRIGPGLLALPEPGEFAVVLAKKVHRVRLDPAGITAVRSRDLWLVATLNLIHPRLSGDHLVFAGGLALNATTLEDSAPYGSSLQHPSRTAVLPYPDLGKVLFADEGWRIQTFDVLSREPEGLVGWQSNVQANRIVERMVRWGDRGAALLSWEERRLLLLDDPVRLRPVADLALTMALPPRVPWPEGQVRHRGPTATLTVTNRGPDTAAGVVIHWNGGHLGSVPELAPGQSTVFTSTLPMSVTGSHTFTVRAVSTTVDPEPANNEASARTWLEPIQWPTETITELDARHLITSPDGTELWVANGPELGVEGITRINPATGSILRTVPVGLDPRRIAAAPDGSTVHAMLGTNRVVRWNFATESIDAVMTFGPDPVLDLASLPPSGNEVAVLFHNRIVLQSGSNILHQVSLPSDPGRALSRAGSQLWTAGAGELRIYNVLGGVLTLSRSRSIPFTGNGYAFQTDGIWAAFSDGVLNPATGISVSTVAGSAPLLPAAGPTFYNLVGHRLRELVLLDPSFPSITPRSETLIAATYGAGPIADQVRWGSGGFAFRTSSGMIASVQKPFDAAKQANLGLSIIRASPTYYNHPSGFRVTVTNRGPDAVSRILVDIAFLGADSFTSSLPVLQEAGRIFVHVGALASGQSTDFEITGIPTKLPFDGNEVRMLAYATSEATDTNLEDSGTEGAFDIRAIPADLGVRLDLPPILKPGEIFEVVCTLTNAGPSAVLSPALAFQLPQGVEYLGVVDRHEPENSGGLLTVHNVTKRLDPGTAVQLRLRFRSSIPGVAVLTAYTSLFLDDPNPASNRARAILHIPAADGDTRSPRFLVGFNNGQWSPTLQQWIVAEAGGIVFLDADSLEPKGSMDLGQPFGNYLINPEGSHLWIEQLSGNIARVNLGTGVVEQEIPTSGLTSPNSIGFASVPGRPDLLIRFGSEEPDGPTARIFSGNAALPLTYSDDLRHSGQGLRAAATASGRVYVSTGGQLRELEITAQGLQLLRNLDSLNPGGGNAPFSVTDNLLVRPRSAPIDLATLQPVPQIPSGLLIAPAIDHILYNFLTGSPASVEAFDTRLRRWVHRHSPAPLTQLVAGGNRGLLALGPQGGRIPLSLERKTDLRLAVTGVPNPSGPGRDFEIPLLLTQADGWQATSARIQATLPNGLELVSPQSTGAPGGFEITPEAGSTPLVLRLRSSLPGSFRIGIEATSTGGDPTPDDARVQLDLFVPPPPVLVLADQTVMDNSTILEFQLSAPAPETMVFVLEAEHLTTQPTDLRETRGELTFPPGSRNAIVHWIATDTIVEPDEQFRVRLVSGPAPAVPTNATITIRNDDRATLRSNAETRPEGSAGISTAWLTTWIDSPIEMPVEIEFTTVPGSASAGQDFVTTAGRLRFTPSSTTNRVGIPIVGDSQFEPDENFTIGWGRTDGVAVPTSQPRFTLVNDDPIPRPLLGTVLDADQSVRLQFHSSPGVRYTLQSTASPMAGTWQREGPIVIGTGFPMEIRPATTTDGLRFYRLLAQ
jgi:DNA-binding beta-propeller fold protein YncE